MPNLYIVGTPIGNLQDITLRALEVLKQVDIIVCEDTRHSSRLLSTYEIRKPLISCHGHNEQRAADRVVRNLEEGKDAAYVSDAGTPGISDPGVVLVRQVVDAGFDVVPIPGPSALATLLSVSGMPGKTLVFEGFLSPKSGRRRTRLAELLERGESFMVYESPYRVVKLLSDLSSLDPERSIVVGREMTKMYEEYLRGTVSSVLETLQSRAAIKGEFAVLVGPAKKG